MALAESTHIPASGHGSLTSVRRADMKKYTVVIGVLFFGLLIIWFIARPELVEMVWKEKTVDEQVREPSVTYARKYIEDVYADLPGEEENNPKAKENISLWEDRILVFGKNHGLHLKGAQDVRLLAEKTVRLLSFLKEAKDRQQEGLEPYTAISGFNTMTLVMAIESEFKEKLGISFSDFFASQDFDMLKRELD